MQRGRRQGIKQRIKIFKTVFVNGIDSDLSSYESDD